MQPVVGELVRESVIVNTDDPTNPEQFIDALSQMCNIGYRNFITKREIDKVQNNPKVAEAVLEEIIENNHLISQLNKKLQNREKEINNWMDCILDLQKHIDWSQRGEMT